MDTEGEADQSQTPDKLRERRARAADEEDDPIMGVIMGANDNSYLLKSGGKFDVLRNVSRGGGGGGSGCRRHERASLSF